MTEMRTRPSALEAMAVPWTKSHRRAPTGSMQARVVMTTTRMDRSCSVTGSSSPLPRRAEAARDSRMPETMGPRILMKVHTAAMAIVPAPTKRTSEAKVVETRSERSVPWSPATWPEVRSGSRIP